MKSIHRALVLILFAVLARGYAQTHYCMSDTNTVRKMGGGGIGVIKPGVPLENLDFTESKSGLLMYIEKTMDHDKSFGGSLAGTQREFRDLYKRNYEEYWGPRGVSYDPERITRKLHIITPDGEDKYVIPIPDKCGGLYGQGFFPNDHFVEFDATPRQGPTLAFHIVNLETAKVFTCTLTKDFELIQPSYSPDGKRFAIELRDRATSVSIFFVDGKMMLPYCDPEPPLPTASPEEFDRSLERFKKKLPDYRELTLGSRSWSYDGRFLFFVQPRGYRDDPGKPAVSESSLLILDTEKASPGKEYRDYCVRVPFQLPEGIGKTLGEMERLDRTRAELLPYLLEDENAVELVLEERPEAKFRMPLPPGWKNADTIRAALEKAKAQTSAPPTSSE
jgi:hypothetical protein